MPSSYTKALMKLQVTHATRLLHKSFIMVSNHKHLPGSKNGENDSPADGGRIDAMMSEVRAPKPFIRCGEWDPRRS